MNSGDKVSSNFSYTISDGVNTDSADVIINIEGTNDAPVISSSIDGNNQGYKVVDGLLDVNGDGVVDTINPDDLTVADKGITFLNESGDLHIDMGTVSASMTVEYNGGQAGFHNALGYYTKDINGNLEAHIIYVENKSMVGSQSEMLGTLNNLTGEVGFFIIPNGGNNGITTDSTITFNSTGQMLINGNVQTVYYTDNDLNSDGLDHVVAGMAEDGSGLVIGFEDLKLGDKDFDDVVITINACKPLGTVTKTTLLVEDFENVTRGTDETVGGTAWYIDNGTATNGILISSDNNKWQMNTSGIEMREDDGVHGLDTANGSDTYIELDAHTSGVNSSISTQVNLGSNDSYNLSFDFTPRPSSLDSSDMKFSLDGQIVQINVDSSGNVTSVIPDGVEVSITPITGTSWYKVEATFNNVTSSSAELSFAGTGNADTLGAYMDNIKLVGNDYSAANTILTNIDLSDVDNANLASAKVELTNYKTGDIIGAPANDYGITVTVNAGVVTLTGSATKAQYEEVLESLTFASTSEDRTPRTFEFIVNDGDKTSNTMKLTLDIGGCSLNPANTIPTSTDGFVMTYEDTSKIISLLNFGTYNDVNGDSLNSVKINTLPNPNDGVLTLNGVAISAGVVISASDIINNKLVFTPTLNTDVDSSFTFQVSDGKEWSSTHTTTIEVIAVADEPTASIKYELDSVTEKTTSINVSNVSSKGMGYTVTALDINNKETVISKISGTDHDGFGVGSNTSQYGANPGADTEIQYDSKTGKTESLVIEFDKDVTSVDVSFAWKHGYAFSNKVGETAVITFFKDGKPVESISHNGGTDRVDRPLTFAPSSGVTFDKIVFTALGQGDDYLINKITFDEVTEKIYNVDISAALYDTDGSETLTVSITGVPTGAKFDIAGITDKGNGVWEVTVPSDKTSISNSLKMIVPAGTEGFKLGITARATETNDNDDGENNIQTLMGDDIDLSAIVTKTTNVLNMENSSTTDKLKVELQDILDLNNKELVIKGDMGDMVDLDKPIDWVKGQSQEIDGKNYNVYTNSTVKLLIEDDIDVIPDI
jgi:hypothetical protein